jgi:Skp family chaperone for outer membrane proteins
MNLFHVKTHNIQNYMMDIQHRVEAFEQYQKQYYNEVKQTTQQLITSIITSSVTAVKQTRNSIVAEKIQHFEERG